MPASPLEETLQPDASPFAPTAAQPAHTIRGIEGGRGLVGPPLNGVRDRMTIAGELPNTPENLIRWIQHPHTVEPNTIMPDMNISEDDGRNIAAYLYTLR